MRRLALLVVLAACRAKAGDGPPCSAVAGRFFMLAHTELDKAQVERSGSAGPRSAAEGQRGEPIDDTLRRAVADQLPAMRDSLDQICGEGKWSAAVRDCMVKAEDRVALEACERQLTDDQRAALDRSTRGETTSP